jgi:hypothetical protein
VVQYSCRGAGHAAEEDEVQVQVHVFVLMCRCMCMCAEGRCRADFSLLLALRRQKCFHQLIPTCLAFLNEIGIGN